MSRAGTVGPPPKVLLAWSSGKDSAWALHVLRETAEVEVAGLLTTFNDRYGRVAMHGVRIELVREQARAVGLPLLEVPLPDPCSNADYEAAMSKALARAKADGITTVAFGDLFLQDVRRYREERLAPTGLAPLFPLWGREPRQLAAETVGRGLRAKIVCVDGQQLDPVFVGRDYDERLLAALPPGVDPCGENGEFHTFAWAGPMFAESVRVHPGEIVVRDRFTWVDLAAATT